MKKTALILGLLLLSTVSYAGTPESDAEMTIKRYCPGESTITNRSLCLEAHNVKLQLKILDKLEKLEQEVQDIQKAQTGKK